MFLDEALAEFASGRGGSGAVSFHREKFVPNGGPNGADGGRGGSIVLIADRHKRTLYDFKFQSRYEADSGRHASGNKRGKDSKNLVIKLPIGTVVTDATTGELLVDLRYDGAKFEICRGGKGGKGNQHYANSVRQAPNFAQKGGPNEQVTAKLELKLLADVGLVGMPNAGKSTLISQVSAAKPKIADYPFTTIVPNLGVVRFHGAEFVVADMPGLIEGASRGVGLGHQFLKHVERTRVIVHVVDCVPLDESDPIANYDMIERELRLYSEEIAARPRSIALNKIDVLSPGELKKIAGKFERFGVPLFTISAATGRGIEPLLDHLIVTLRDADPEPPVPILRPIPVNAEPKDWKVTKTDEGFQIIGARIRRMVEMTDLANMEAVQYLHRRLSRLGVIRALLDLGAEDGDSVFVGDVEFSFSDEA